MENNKEKCVNEIKRLERKRIRMNNMDKSFMFAGVLAVEIGLLAMALFINLFVPPIKYIFLLISALFAVSGAGCFGYGLHMKKTDTRRKKINKINDEIEKLREELDRLSRAQTKTRLVYKTQTPTYSTIKRSNTYLNYKSDDKNLRL